MNAILASFIQQPALIEDGRAAWLESCAGQAQMFLADARHEMAGNEGFWFADDDWRANYRPYIVKDGVLQIPVKGLLLNDFPWQLGSWATGYEYIRAAFDRGMDDSSVKGIALVIDSGGGMVSGNFDLVDRMFARRGEKPIHSYAAEHAYSAAYIIASVGDEITVGRTGGVGSIGVVVVHAEYSKALADEGITVTVIRSKPGKMERNAYEPLTNEAAKRMQERVDAFHQEFVAIVARNRGMSEKAVDDTNALTFMPQEAVNNGLADKIGAFEDALPAFVAYLNSEGEEAMAEKPEANTPTITQATVDAARAEGITEGKTTGHAEGVSAERARIRAVVESDEGKKRPLAALDVALDDAFAALDAAALTKMLAKMPVETGKADDEKQNLGAGAGKKLFTAAMGNTPNPDLSAGEGDEGGERMSRAQRTILMTGGKLPGQKT